MRYDDTNNAEHLMASSYKLEELAGVNEDFRNCIEKHKYKAPYSEIDPVPFTGLTVGGTVPPLIDRASGSNLLPPVS